MILSDFLELYFVYEYININNVIEDTLTAVTDATVTTVEFMHHKCIPPFKKVSSEKKKTQTNDKLS